MKSMNKKELIETVVGVDEKNMPNSFVGMYLDFWGKEGFIHREAEYTFFKPVIEIFSHLDYVQVDFKFKSPADQDLNIMWNALEEYCQSGNSADEADGKYLLLIINIVPKKYEGKYSIMATNPMIHTLQPDSPSGAPTVIRMVFKDDNVDFLQHKESE